MGEHNVNSSIDNLTRTDFIRHLLNDIEALDIMLAKGLIESDITRIGSEQEFCLVNDQWRPSRKGQEILKDINDPHFTTELALYNLEINLDPIELKGNCFTQVENQLHRLLSKAMKIARQQDTEVVLTGILPTISKTELTFDYMTPNPRYWALNEVMKKIRGSDFELNIRGVDHLALMHDTVLFEACNTSFQIHLQIAPDDFVSSYNWAQAISGPVLAMCTNSPLLLGRELWSETRIALFQQSIDTRCKSYSIKDQRARVTFGDAWAQGNISDIFKNEIASYKVILARDIELDSMQELENGKIPKLEALSLHNGSIYRWNRPCYGVGNGKPHVRIENRYIPSGPTVIDEMANFAFWVGLMKGRPSNFDDMPSCMDFKEAKLNFIKAARSGKESVMNWLGSSVWVKDLILDELLPIAYSGLEKCNVDKKDIDRLLGVIKHRASGLTGSQWKVKKYRALRKVMTQDDSLLALTKSIHHNQLSNKPVHEWTVMDEVPSLHETAYKVQHIMSTQLFTVNENDLAALATNVMHWKNIHHLPVENNEGNLSGLLTWTHMKNFRNLPDKGLNMNVEDIMTTEIISVPPEAKIMDAIKLMKKNVIGCLPVVQNQQLVGIITINDLLKFDNAKSSQQTTS